MDTKLFSQAMVKFLGGVLIVGLLLFLPAGSFGYENWRDAGKLAGEQNQASAPGGSNILPVRKSLVKG